jgi:hypothetical protein
MIDPRHGEQLELFPETKPEPKKGKKKQLTLILSEKEVEMIEDLRWVVDQIQSAHICEDEDDEFDEYEEYSEAERLELHKSWMIQRLRADLGVPEYLAKEWVMPLYNVPHADSEYLLEHLLESFNPPLFKKYVAEKEAFFNQLLKGDAS